MSLSGWIIVFLSSTRQINEAKVALPLLISKSNIVNVNQKQRAKVELISVFAH